MPVGRDCWLCLSAIWHHHRGQACGSWSFWRGHVTGPSLLTIIIAVGHFSQPLATRLATIKRRGQQVAHLCCDCICIVGRWGKFFKFCTYDTGHAHLLATAFVRSFFFFCYPCFFCTSKWSNYFLFRIFHQSIHAHERISCNLAVT